tara:strand:- start:99 stop:335 length:237 start_codon:yes stop_codon:yes gene_type:complete
MQEILTSNINKMLEDLTKQMSDSKATLDLEVSKLSPEMQKELKPALLSMMDMDTKDSTNPFKDLQKITKILQSGDNNK